MTKQTEQEKFWAGEFGEEYIDRNSSAALLAANLNYFSRSLHQAWGVQSILELGANVGMNMKALRQLLPAVDLHGVEINASAADALRDEIGAERVFEGSIFDYPVDRTFDLTFTKGVLIHLNPEKLPEAYAKLYTASSKYILVGEYYNPAPVAIEYRGHSDKLFKRDFCGDMLQAYPDLELVDYGFAYRRDPNFPQDDISWFLMKKA